MITYYKRNDPDHEEPDLVAKHVEPRLYSKPCFEAEYDLCMVVISMVNLLVAIFSLLSVNLRNWNKHHHLKWKLIYAFNSRLGT